MIVVLQAEAVSKTLDLWPVLGLAFLVCAGLTPVIVFLFKRYEKAQQERRSERDEAHRKEVEGRDKALTVTLESHERAYRSLGLELTGAIQRSSEATTSVVNELIRELHGPRRRT